MSQVGQNMTKKINLDRIRALQQILRWQAIYDKLDEEIRKEGPKSLEQIIEELQETWEKEFITYTADYKRKPKFRPL